MSFWDDLAGLFTGDTYFPDNPNREARAKELARDCQNYTASLAMLTESIKNELGMLDKQLAELYGHPANIPSDLQPIEMDFNGLGFEVSQLVAPLLSIPVVTEALTVGATSYLLSAGEIGAAGLVELVGLPTTFSIGIGAVAGVAAFGISLGIGALEGSVKRDKLRATIHQGVEGRIKLAMAFLINSQLESSIHAMLSAIEALQEAHVPISAVMDRLQAMIAAAHEHIYATTIDTAVTMLAQLDASRGSWTNEDR